MTKPEEWLVADVGGTNTRCAVANAIDTSLRQLRSYVNDEFADLESLLLQHVRDCAGPARRQLALAIAAPVVDGPISMINRAWIISRSSLRKTLELAQLFIINDFHAVGYSLAAMNDDKRIRIGGGEPDPDGNLAVLGPGTGLGVSGLIRSNAGSIAISGEGGHVTLAAESAEEASILRRLRERFGHCSAERVLSGPGIQALHWAMHGSEPDSARTITDAAKAGDAAAEATMDQFFGFLGNVAANLALTLGAVGGVYMAGGIVPKNIELLRQSDFRGRFESKGRYREYLRQIPSYVILDPEPGLAGLHEYIKRQLNQSDRPQ